MGRVEASGAVIEVPTARTELLTIRHGDHVVPAALTRDPTRDVGACLVIVPPADYHALHDARWTWKALAQQVAPAGVSTFRFGYVGAGDATGRGARFNRSDPRAAEVRAAVTAVRERGATTVIGIGSCYGASMLLAAAARGAEFDALGLTSLQVLPEDRAEVSATRHSWMSYLRRGFSLEAARAVFAPERRRRYRRAVSAKLKMTYSQTVTPGRSTVGTSRHAVESLWRVADDGPPIMLLFGEEDEELGRFRGLLDGPLAGLVESPRVEMSVVPGRLHGLHRLASQKQMAAVIAPWVIRQADALDPGRAEALSADAGAPD